MNVHYEKLESPRFKVETSTGQERIEIPPQRQVLLSLFLVVWLCGWTFAGVSVGSTVLAKGVNPLLVVWLGAWVFGWSYAVLTLGWMLTGSEILAIVGGDLEITYRILGISIRKLYRGREVRHLAARTPIFGGRRFNMGLPFLKSSTNGSITFSYGARTIYAGAGLDEEEGRQIVARLLKRLPASASD